MKPQPIPNIQPTVIIRNGASVKLAPSVPQHVAKVTRDAAADSARRLEDHEFGDSYSPPAYVSAASEVVEAQIDAESFLAATKALRDEVQAAIGILDGSAITYPAILATKPVIAAALEIRAAADGLLAFDPDAADAETGPVCDQLRAMLKTLDSDIATAERHLAAAETEARRCVGAAYAATADHGVARKRFADAGLQDWLPKDWPKGIQPLGAAQLVADNISQRRIARHERRNAKRNAHSNAVNAAEARILRQAAIDAKNDETAEAIAKIMKEG